MEEYCPCELKVKLTRCTTQSVKTAVQALVNLGLGTSYVIMQRMFKGLMFELHRGKCSVHGA